MEKKTWQINETQTAFLEALKANGGKATLFELNHLQGKNFKSGSINALIGKGLVRADDEVTYECDKVYNGIKVGTVKVTAKVYELVNAD
jgi:hypothetical protein